MGTVCVDASLVLAWLLPEDISPAAYRLQERWDEQGDEMIAPALMPFEVTSTLRRAVHLGRLTAEEADEAFEAFLEMGIRLRQPEELPRQAWEWGKTLQPSRLYDMYYVALAHVEKCELWTADRKLVKLVGDRSSLVRWVGEMAEAVRV